MSTTESLSQSEKRAYELIETQDGLLQSDLWKELDTSSRQGSRLAKSLEEKGLIKREQTTQKGQRTYRLKPTNGHSPSIELSKNGSTETIAEEYPSENLTEREKRALSLIQDRGGLYQSELWKELDVSSRSGSRTATTLAEKGLIRREKSTYNGRQTYLLQPAKKDLDFSLLMAGDMISPLIGDDEIDPVESGAFTQWVLELTQERR